MAGRRATDRDAGGRAAFVGAQVVLGPLAGAAIGGEFGEAEGQLLALAVFVPFGATLLPDLTGLVWRHGWFGPRGLASVIYLLPVLEQYEIEGVDDVRLAALVTVALSIVLHGASAAPLARRYGRAVESGGVGGAEDERVPGFALKLGGARAEDGAREGGGR